uniref:Chitin elicitor receptor kinase 1-like isoform X1 n=1 Tax=Nicotiana sylvestris TaxID=4096 RepID=A0A1U7YC05_NICSY|nr:PREDICTED: chitin elicitor receptor kinase 1-like isoform X1 [Nicotiana sylvestris]
MYLFQRITIILFVIYYFFPVHYYYAVVADSRCTEGCALALASYSLHRGYYDEFVSDVSRRLFPNVSVPEILSYNPSFVIPLTQAEAEIIIKIKIPFRCDCLNNGDYLGHVFPYNLRSGDTYGSVAAEYSDLVTEEWLMRVNSYPYNNIPDNNVTLNVIVNCSCGNKDVSEDYGLFITYPMRPGESLESIALATDTSSELIQMYNPAVNFSAGTGLLYIPGRDKLGKYPPMPTSKGSSGKFIAGMAVASLAGVTLLIGIIYVGIYRKKAQKVVPHISASADQSHPSGQGLLGIAVDKSVEFSYKELAESTNGFSISNKIGEGGVGAIYYAELRGKVCNSNFFSSNNCKNMSACLLWKLNYFYLVHVCS